MNNNSNTNKISKEGLYRVLLFSWLILFLLISLAIGAPNFIKELPKNWTGLLASGVFLSSRPAAEEKIVIKTPSLNLPTGEKSEITWDHLNKSGDGSYSIYYPCRNGFYLEIVNAGKNYLTFCNVPENFLNKEDKLVIIPHSEKNRYLDVPLSIRFVPNGATEATAVGTTLLTIFNEKLATSPDLLPKDKTLAINQPTEEKIMDSSNSSLENKENKKITPSHNQSAPVNKKEDGNKNSPGSSGQREGTKTEITVEMGSGVISQENGRPDLAVKILEIGKIIVSQNNEFVATTTLKSTDRVAVKFEVVNLGTKKSDSWRFNAVLPTFPLYIFHSEMQPAIAPNDKIIYTIGFDKIEKPDGNQVTINLDPADNISEVSETNNIAKITINGVVF
jgi:hypothetical protein